MKNLLTTIVLIIMSGIFVPPVRAAQITSGVTATASNQFTASTAPDNVLDGNPATNWNAGNYAPQWIRLDLGQNRSINQINLLTIQTPDGLTTHTITVSPDLASTPKTIITIDKYTHDGEWIHIPLPKVENDVRYITITTTRSPSWVGWKEIEIYEGTSVAAQHLKYFGYYNVDGIPFSSMNHIPEIDTMHNSNVSHIMVGYEAVRSDDVKVPEMLSSMHEYHTKAIINVVHLFFEIAPGYPLYNDWQARWQRFQNQIRGHESDIYAFYFDEPMANNIPKDEFLAITLRIRQDYPDHALMVVESGNQPLDLSYYANVTDIGFDLYYSGLNATWDEFAIPFDSFYKKYTNKKIWIIPDGIAQNTTQMATWPDVFSKYYSLALTNDRVVGILNFLWPPLKSLEPMWQFSLQDALSPSSPTYISALRTLHEEAGRSIVTNASVSTKFGDLNFDGKVDILDNNILVGNFGKAGTGINGDIDSNGKVDIFDYNELVTNFGK